mmetsp:Transcript_99828/g.277798  ORF Transcript_99828/g.277798 Transcript_99828/m.277798 type:complete len:309 (+) Transcript_99828:333-1259(+)
MERSATIVTPGSEEAMHMGDNPQSPDSPVLAAREARAARGLEADTLELSGPEAAAGLGDGSGTEERRDGEAPVAGVSAAKAELRVAVDGKAADDVDANGTPFAKKDVHGSPILRSASVTEATLRPMHLGCTDCCSEGAADAREACDACPHCADTCGNAACPECCWKRYSVEARTQSLALDGAPVTVDAARSGGTKMRRAFSVTERRVGADTRSKKGSGKARITMCQLRRHNTRESLWLAAHGKVYDVTPFVELHPGGERSLLRHAGQDSTVDFDFHSSGAQKLWKEYQIGTIVRCPSEGDGGGRCVIS